MDHKNGQQSNPCDPQEGPEFLQKVGIIVDGILAREQLEIADQMHDHEAGEHGPGQGRGGLHSHRRGMKGLQPTEDAIARGESIRSVKSLCRCGTGHVSVGDLDGAYF
jgi:hypothetical protein